MSRKLCFNTTETLKLMLMGCTLDCDICYVITSWRLNPNGEHPSCYIRNEVKRKLDENKHILEQ
jgi:hypothetical protein